MELVARELQLEGEALRLQGGQTLQNLECNF